MPIKTAQAAFQALPGPMRVFLTSPNTIKQFKTLANETHKLNDQELDAISSLIGEIDLGYKPLSELVPEIVKRIKWPEDRAKKFASDVAGYRYLPLADLLKVNVWAQIEAWGGDPKNYPAQKIEARKVTEKTLIDELIKETRITLPPRMGQRFRHIMDSRLKGVRDDLELGSMLTRPQKVGGVGLSQEDAGRVLGILRLKLANAQIVEEGTVSPPPTTPTAPPPVAPGAPKTSTPPPPATTRPKPEEALPAAKRYLKTPTPDEEELELSEEEEIAAIKESMAGKIPDESTKIAGLRAKSIESVQNIAKIKFTSPEMKRRFISTADARLRDLRDSSETLAMLVAAPATGGLGLKEEQAKQLNTLLDAEFFALQKSLESTKKRQAIAGIKERNAKEHIASLKKAQQKQAEVEDRFIKTVKKSTILKERGAVLPPLHQPAPKIKPVLSPGSVPPDQSKKPQIADVKFTRKLAGPIEELRKMTMADFRRLSKNPKEATEKVRDKIELLKEGGSQQYQTAVKAWQQSEPNRLYLSLSRAALETGKPIPEAITEHQSRNEPTLTLEEFQAILALNTKLR